MEEYDAYQPPLPEEWLALDENQRVALVAKYHREQLEEVPNERMHAIVHVVVENQIALGLHYVVETLHRLMGEGLDRHDAVHAIGSVLVDYSYEIVNDEQSTFQDVEDEYARRLNDLTAEGWWKGQW